MRVFSVKKRKLALVVIVPMIVVATSFGLLYHSPGWRFSRSYSRLEFGMSKDDVRALFGRDPDFDCRYKSYEIWYYRAPGFFADKFDNVKLSRGATVPSLRDLPDVYDHVQLAFDAQGRLHAYTWIGESYTVQSKNGSACGSHLAKLPPSDF